MESFVHLRKGRTPKRLHADLDGLKDDELGRGGFTGRTANIYRRHDPTAYRASGPLRPVDVLSSELKPSDATDAAGGPLLLFSNADCRISLSPTQRADAVLRPPRRRRPAVLRARRRRPAGDRVRAAALPGGRLDLHAQGLHLAAGARRRDHAADGRGHRRVPGATAGPLGRHFPFDPSQATIPEPAPIDDDGRDEYEVRLIHEGGPTSLYYQHNPIDVEGWRGDNFPFTFNIADYNVVTSESVHLPPTVHLFMQATGVDVMNFLPRPAESVPGTERTPWYHRNVDYDEIAFFHGGSLYGIPMPPGLISHAPQGVHHGAPEKARERARRKFDERQGRMASHRDRHPAAAHSVG